MQVTSNIGISSEIQKNKDMKKQKTKNKRKQTNNTYMKLKQSWMINNKLIAHHLFKKKNQQKFNY